MSADPSEPDAEFATFVTRHYPRLLHTADLLTGDRGRAEDILQTGVPLPRKQN